MAEKIALDIQISTLNSAESIGALKTGIKELTRELEKLPEGSEQFKKTAEAIGNAKDKLADLNEEVVQTTTKAGKFQAVLGIGQQIAAGFQLAQSAVALFGEESEAVGKALQKVQAAMGFIQAIKELEGLGDAWKNFKTVAVDALKGVKTGIAATGIGLLVVALGTIVAYWEDIKELVSGVSEEQKDLLEAQTKAADAAKANLEAVSKQENILKLQGKTEKEILQLKQAATKEQILALKAQLTTQESMRQSQIETAKRNRDILEGILKFLTVPITFLLKTVDTVGEVLGKDFGLEEGLYKNVAELVFDPEETQKNADDSIQKTKDALRDLENQQAGFQLSINKINEDAVAKAKEAAKQRIELQKELNNQLAQARIDSIDDDREKAKAQEIFNYEQSKKELETKFKGQKELNDLLFELEMKHKNALSEIDNNFNIAEDKKKKEREDKAKAEADKKREELLAGIKKDQADQLSEYETRIKTQQRLGEDSTALELEAAKYKLDTILNDENASYEQRLAAQEEYNAKVKELDNKAAEDKKAIKEAELNLISDSLKLASDMITFYAKGDEASQKKAFEINKKVQLAMATIDMYRGIMGAFESAMDSPLAGIFPAYPYIQAAMAGAYGLMNINKIAQTQYESASSGAAGGMEGAAGGAGGAMSAPLQGGVNNTSTMLENLGQGQQEQKPIKAYVLQTDVASEDQKIKAIENKSKIE